MKKILSILFAIAGVVALAAPVKSMLGADSTEIIESDMPTAADYIQDGLVAMWDGIENAGYGIHDNNAAVWVDLSGNGHDISVSSSAFNYNSYNLAVKSRIGFTEALDYATVEFVGDITLMRNDSGGIFFQLRASSIAFGRYNSIGIFSINNYHWTYNQFVLPSPYPNSIVIVYRPNQAKQGWFDGQVPSKATETWTNVPNYSFIGNPYDSGRCYCVRVYSRALTPEEIAYNYLIDKIRFNLP